VNEQIAERVAEWAAQRAQQLVDAGVPAHTAAEQARTEALATYHEATQAGQAVGTATRASSLTQPDAPWASHFVEPQLDPRKLVETYLVKLEGLSREDALATLLDANGDLSPWQAQLDQAHQRAVEQAEETARLEWMKTEDGKMARAAELRQTAALKTERYEAGKLILEDQGFAAADIGKLTPDEVIEAVFQVKPDNSNDLAANMAAATGSAGEGR
jgi:hypothetical protein